MAIAVAIAVGVVVLTNNVLLPMQQHLSHGRKCNAIPLRQPVGLASAESLVEKFDATVFRNDDKPGIILPYVWKWEGIVRLDSSSVDPTLAEFKDQLIAEISCLTGLVIEEWDRWSKHARDFWVLFVDEKTVDNFRTSAVFTADEFKRVKSQVLCFLQYRHDGKGGIDSVVVWIRASLPSDILRSCLHEEIAQGFGLSGDSEIIANSLFSDAPQRPNRLTINDKILIRALYDRRIRSGMTRDQVMAVVAHVIPELVDAVNRDGEAALFQR